MRAVELRCFLEGVFGAARQQEREQQQQQQQEQGKQGAQSSMQHEQQQQPQPDDAHTQHATPSAPVTLFPDCTWLRIRGHADVTVEHTDYYYFKQERSIFSDHTWQHQQNQRQQHIQQQHQRQQQQQQAAVTDGSVQQQPVNMVSQSAAADTCSLCSAPVTAAVTSASKSASATATASTASTLSPTLQCALCRHTFHRHCITPAPPLRPRGGYYCHHCCNAPFPFFTCWLALGPVHKQHGRLALVPGSHRLQGYDERRAGGGDGKLPRGWTAAVRRAAVWRSSDMSAGDLLLFNVKTVHAASSNESAAYRISLDTRVTYAPRREEQDERQQQAQTQQQLAEPVGRAVSKAKARHDIDERQRVVERCVLEESESGGQRRSMRVRRGAGDADAEWKRMQQAESSSKGKRCRRT